MAMKRIKAGRPDVEPDKIEIDPNAPMPAKAEQQIKAIIEKGRKKGSSPTRK